MGTVTRALELPGYPRHVARGKQAPERGSLRSFLNDRLNRARETARGSGDLVALADVALCAAALMMLRARASDQDVLAQLQSDLEHADPAVRTAAHNLWGAWQAATAGGPARRRSTADALKRA
jgi:hypothetical protein